MTDTERLPEWLGEFKEAHEETSGPTGVGTIVNYTVEGDRSGTLEIVEWDPPNRMAWDGPPLPWAGGGARPRGSHTLAEAGKGRTLLVSRYEPELTGDLGLPAAVLELVVAASTSKGCADPEGGAGGESVTLTSQAIVWEFFERIEKEDTEGVLELLDPGVVMLGTHGGLDAHLVVRGSDALLEYLQEVEQFWEEFEVEVERVIVSDDKGVAFLWETARGRGEISLQNETAMVFKIRDGRIAEVQGYLDRDEALGAAGLSE